MYNTSTSYKTEIQKRSRKFECKVTIGDRIFSNNEVQSIELNGGIQDVFSIGNTPSMCLDLVLRNTTDTIFTTNPVKVEIGLKIDNTIEYVPLGIFNIEDIKKDDYTTKFTCYDNMSKFESAYFSNLGDTPTLTQVVNELSSKTGIQFIGNLPAYDVKKLEGFTCREILGYIASLCGGNALITRDGKFTIVYPTDVNRDIGEGVFDLKRDEVKYKIGKVTCQIKEKEIISKGSLGIDSMELMFENPWVTETILTDIYNRLNGFSYLGYTMKWQGDLSLDVGDIITHTDTKGVTRKLPILTRKLSYDGGLDSELSAKGETKNSNSFSPSGSMKNKIERVVTEVALINKAFIDYAHINDADIVNLKAQTAKIQVIEAEAANINNILAGNIGSGSVQTIHLTGKNVVIDKAIIKDVMIDTVSATKIKTGTLDTNLVTVQGSSGNLLIKDNTIQIKDSTRVRVQIGKDASNDYSMYVWDKQGNLMFDALGIKSSAIKDKIIRDDMITDNANINGSKINISSLISEFNKDTNTQLIKASKVALDLTGQSLELSFNTLKSNVDNIQVGGRNLLRNSNFNYKNLQYWNKNGMASYVEVDNKDAARIGDGLSTTGIYQTVTDLSSKPSFYTITFEAKAITPNAKVRIGFLNAAGANTTITLTDSWAKYSYTTTSLVDVTIAGKQIVHIYANGSEFYTTNIKVEKGTKATDFIVAPEDTEEKITANTTSINAINGQISALISENTITKGDLTTLKNNYTSIKATVDGINTTVASHTSSISSLNNKVSTAESNITQLNNKIALKVEQTDITNAINNLSIGGRNLVLDTEFKNLWSIWNTTKSSVVATESGQKLMFNDITQSAILSALTEKLVKGEKYTLSFEARGNLNKTEVYIITTTSPNSQVFAKVGVINESSYTKITFTFSYSSDNISNKLFIGGISSLAGQWIEIKKNSIKIEKGDKATDWTPAPEDVDSSINVVDGKVSTLNTTVSTVSNKVATIETSLSSITNRVSSTESSITTINNNVTSLQTKVNTVEQKITATALTTTISSAINAGTSSISTTQFVMDSTGFTVKNGAIRILNKSNAEVLAGDVNGNLRLTGRLDNINGGRSVSINNGMVYAYTNNVLNFSLGNNALNLYDYFDTIKETKVGDIFSTRTSSNGVLGMGLAVERNQQLTIGYNVADNSFIPFMRFNKDMNYGVQYPINVLEEMYFNNSLRLGFGRNPEIGGTASIKGADGWMQIDLPANASGRGLWIKNSYTAQQYMHFTEGQTYKAWIEPSCYVNGNLYANGSIACSGSKTRVVETESYNSRRLNAYESADCLFADYGSGVIGEDGICIVSLDDIFLETVNTNKTYRVFLTTYDENDKFEDIKLKVIKKSYNYFAVKGNIGLEFDWNIVAKQKGFEEDRLLDHDREVKMDKEEILKFNLLQNQEAKDNIRNTEEQLIDSLKVTTAEDILMEDIFTDAEYILMGGM